MCNDRDSRFNSKTEKNLKIKRQNFVRSFIYSILLTPRLKCTYDSYNFGFENFFKKSKRPFVITKATKIFLKPPIKLYYQ